MPMSEALLQDELRQRQEEGCDVASLQSRVAGADAGDRAGLEVLFAAAAALSADEALARREPTDLAAIRALRPDGPRHYDAAFTESYLRDRLAGAWLGRAAGCLLGKPCEGWHHDRIRAYLDRAGAYPLDDYFPLLLPNDEPGLTESRRQNWLRGRICLAPRDDDTDYTVLGLHILEENGPDFTTADVAGQWLNHMPYHQVYTAERVAYANLVDGFQPPETATHQNPYREWIGAQIRAHAIGYAHPGRPEAAADMAYRDAALSHVKNGIYGEMWAAATIAAAMVATDPLEAIEAGLTEIPAECRLAQALRDTIAWSRGDDDWEATWQRVNNAYGHYHVVHTINNACAVALALLHGELDFEATIAISVMCGWDTDCNGATAGSILGAMLGAQALPAKWVAPLNDTLESAVQGFGVSRISALAERTLQQATACLAR
ncbi:MAG: ADP-ribosylglycohydrolase family protein [Anaerolineae bacterium]